MAERYSMMMDMFREFSRSERERVINDNRKRLVKLTRDIEFVTDALKLMEAEHTLLLLKE